MFSENLIDVMEQYIEITKTTVDDLLDKYNDYMDLYKVFGDEWYRIEAECAMNEIKMIR